MIESRLARDIQKETELLHSRRRDNAQAVINYDQLFSNQLEDKLNSTTCQDLVLELVRRSLMLHSAQFKQLLTNVNCKYVNHLTALL